MELMYWFVMEGLVLNKNKVPPLISFNRKCRYEFFQTILCYCMYIKQFKYLIVIDVPTAICGFTQETMYVGNDAYRLPKKVLKYTNKLVSL